ncbi:hypothetical protein DLJ49_03895 [Rhodovulum sp. 12E13]|uniref:hypothetical protein n=1 Tax=Rhodovulum sp. 12E13 TaxID=2203891 RepID=UPI000E12B09C|nr:hypothetical protein [Rhodovulum sp. 12E13]RDC74439.1 hypothetical protein DLJ49_03895 [Rhodovulum sp. 12E13]
MQVGTVAVVIGAALLWIDAQYLAGIGASGTPEASLAAPAGFVLLFLGTVVGIGDGMRRLLRRMAA